ncbi:4Fe-4S dicluster domain-containing protein [Fundidesulfovibrio putealis]|uniref:4Fe-4S dicluster domain-containing protein n=1 Tax=Fundidesulfovibrio putealis TaxID=270496 RepID=UPI000A0685C3|nr:MAG: 4Fe-4S [Desulfovibrionaceae bacterium]
MTRLGNGSLLINEELCIGCECCQAVCRFLYNTPRVRLARQPDGRMIPYYCRHCDRPACIRVCPQGAITKESDGRVRLNSLACGYCREKPCLLACRHGGLFCAEADLPVTKCDLCAHRRAEGLPPACAAICPVGAILT